MRYIIVATMVLLMATAAAAPGFLPDNPTTYETAHRRDLRSLPVELDEVEYVIIGADTGISSPYPWIVSTTAPSLRFQSLYHADEIGRAGTITEFAWRIAEDLQYGTFSDVTLKMVHTSYSSLTQVFDDNYDFNTPATVFFATSREAGMHSAGLWCNIELDTAFEYNGTDNLLIEVTWSDATGVSVQLRCPRWTDNRWLVATDREAASGTARPLRHDARIGFGTAGGVKTEGPGGSYRHLLRVTPNPLTSGQATLQFNQPIAEPVTVRLHNASGRRVFDRTITGNSNTTMTLDLRGVPTGIYFLELEAAGLKTTEKLVIQQ